MAVAGICAYDSDAHGLAQRYFHQALRLAKASGDRGLGGYVIALLVNQSLFLAEYRQSVAFAEAALRAAGRDITPALAADLYAMQAKAYAHLGDGHNALECIRRAESEAGRIRPGHEPDETGYVEPGLVNVQVAEALLRLGDLPGAREHAAAAVRSPAHDRGRVHRLAILTHIELRQGRRTERPARRPKWRNGSGDGVAAAAGPAAGGARGSDREWVRRRGAGRRTHRRSAARTALNVPLRSCSCCDVATNMSEGGRTMQWTNLNEQTVYENRWFRVNLADVALPDGRHLDHYLVRLRPVAAATVVNEANEVLLLWRHRFITDSWGWELAAGVVEDGEDIAAAAAREMEEETGWRPGPLRPLLTVEPSNGLTDARHHLYWAQEASWTGHPQDDFESSRREWIPLKLVPDMIARGEVPAANMVAGLMMLHHLRLG